MSSGIPARRVRPRAIRRFLAPALSHTVATECERVCITCRTSLSRERVDGRARRRVETIDDAVTVIEAETAEVTWTAAALRVGYFVKDDDEVTMKECAWLIKHEMGS